MNLLQDEKINTSYLKLGNKKHHKKSNKKSKFEEYVIDTPINMVNISHCGKIFIIKYR